MKLTITKIYKTNKNKEGQPLKTKDGREYTRLGIQTKEYGSKWISGFESSWNNFWTEGQTVEADVEPNGDFLNLKKPDPIAYLVEQVNKLAQRVGKLEESSKNEGYPEAGGHVEEYLSEANEKDIVLPF